MVENSLESEKWLIERKLDLGEAFRAKDIRQQNYTSQTDFMFLLSTVWFDKQYGATVGSLTADEVTSQGQCEQAHRDSASRHTGRVREGTQGLCEQAHPVLRIVLTTAKANVYSFATFYVSALHPNN